MGNQIYFKIAGYVDLDILNMFAVSSYHLSLIVFEIKDEKYYTHFGVISLFSSNFQNFTSFILYFKIYKR
jgi:hypothetical protein